MRARETAKGRAASALAALVLAMEALEVLEALEWAWEAALVRARVAEGRQTEGRTAR